MATPRRSPNITQFYAGRAVLVTGGSGFMGKVLVERLLATCPDIGRVHLLLRDKRGVCPEDRMAALKESPVFNVLRKAQPAQLDKLALVPGDVTRPRLGLSQESLVQLQEVSLVFHSAATVRFHEDLRAAVEQNLLSVIRLMEICDALPNVEVLVHVSTAFSNSERSYIEEKVYPTPLKLQELLDCVDSAQDITEEDSLRIISPKLNTYTFTKSMAEMALVQRDNRRYPVAIFRPTIVVSSLRHPFPGWVENLNGATGVVAGGAAGLLRVCWTRPPAAADLLPVDVAIDTLIAAAWDTATDKPRNVRVYNCSTQRNPCTWRQFGKELNANLVRYPVGAALWYPHLIGVPNTFFFKILEFLLHTVPHHLVTYSARLLGLKLRVDLIRASEKLRQMNREMGYFTRREWQFDEGNVARLRRRLCDQDRDVYNLDPETIDWKQHLANFVKGTRKFVLKEKDEGLEFARRRMQRLYYLHIALKLVLFFFLGGRLFSIIRLQYWDLLGKVYHMQVKRYMRHVTRRMK